MAWDNEVVVFNAASGSTHLINPIAAKILALLQSRPSSALEIAGNIAAETEVDADEEVLQRVEAVLETLDHLGLIEPLQQ